MIAGTLEINLMANLARLQSDMDRAKRTVSNAADAMNKVLGAIGVGVSLAGVTSMIKGVVDAGDKLNDLRKISGLAVEQLGGLGKVASMSGSSLDQVAKAVGVMSKNMYAGVKAFDTLGISTKDASGQMRGANDVLLDVADKFSRMEDGVTKSALANQLFGKSGRELIPMLNEGRAALEASTKAYAENSGMTQKLAEESDRFNDNLEMLGGRVTAVKNSFVGELLPTLNAITTAMLNTGQATGNFGFAANVVVPVLKGLAIAGFTVVDTFKGMGREIGARAAQLTALANLDFKNVAFIGKALAEDNAKSRAEYDKFVKTIMESDKSVEQFTETQKDYLKIEQQMPGVIEKTTKAMKEKKVLTDAEQLALLRQNESTKTTIELAQRVESITNSVATEQEKYNEKLAELDRLKPYLSVETYNRSLEKAQQELRGTAAQTQKTTDQVDQLWTQAGRNIQSTLSNSIFNFFDDGLKGMLKNVAITVGRITSEFAGLKIAQGVGLGAIFGGASGAANASGGGGGISSILNGASMASGAASLFNTGFGATSAASSLGGMLPGSTGAFFSGMGGGTVTGVSSQAALMGAKVASFAGPSIAIAAVDQITRMLMGDKKLSGTAGKILNFVPILGPLINGLFGRGPMKQGMTTLKGEVGAEGFESGRLQTRFDAKGGAFRSNKTDFATVDAVSGKVSTDNGKLNTYAQQLSGVAKDIIGLINDTTKQVSSSLYEMGKNLGLSTEGLDNFNHTIKLVSQSGKGLTEEQIGAEIAKITDELAHSLLPTIDDLSKSGETATQTLTRLSQEFGSLESAAVNLGASSKYAKELIQAMSFDARSSLIELAGGMDALSSKTAFFAQNFFTEAERLVPVTENLKAGLSSLGLSADITKEQFRALVQDVNISNEMRNSLLELAPAFIEVDNANKAMIETIKAVPETIVEAGSDIKKAIVLDTSSLSHSGFMTTMDDVRKRLSAAVVHPFNAAVYSANRLNEVAQTLKDTVNSIIPQSLTDAKRFLQNTISSLTYENSVGQRNYHSPEAIQNAVKTLGTQGTGSFSTRADFLRSQGANAGMINSLYMQLGALPAYAAGSSYVPRTGVAMVHKGERIVNADQNNDLVAAIKELVSTVKQSAVHAKKTADTLVKVTRDGDTLLTTTA